LENARARRKTYRGGRERKKESMRGCGMMQNSETEEGKKGEKGG
jgi:hypothetical protein